MKQVINVLLAEDRRNIQPGMEEILRTRPDINFLAPARDGLRAIEVLRQEEVDLLLLDLVLAEVDGIGVLRSIQDNENKPTIVLVTALTSPLIINQAAKLGAVHTLLKPGDPQYIVDRALEVYRDSSATIIMIDDKPFYSSDIQRIIVEALHSIGMPPQLLGYEYLRMAIIETLKENGRIHGITTQLYPLIAEEYDSTPAKIERSIRHAIETTWNRTSTNAVQKIFGPSVSAENGRPTNSEFIALMMNYVLTETSQLQ